MATEPIRGVSFNTYAIVAFLIITPLYVGLISNFAQGGYDDEYDYDELIPQGATLQTNYNLVDPNDLNSGTIAGGFPTAGNGNTMALVWMDIGENLSQDYIARDGDSFAQTYQYNCWELLKNYPYYGHPQSFDYLGTNYSWYVQEDSPAPFDRTGCRGFRNFPVATPQPTLNTLWVNYEGKHWGLMSDTHAMLTSGDPNSPSYNRQYLGYSGDSFAWTIENPVFQFADDTKTIRGFKVNFHDDPYNNYDCDAISKSNLTFDYSIEIFHKAGNATTHPTTTAGLTSFRYDYNYEGDNIVRRINFQTGSNAPEIICTYGLELKFNFDVFDAMELKEFQEIYDSWENFSAIVRIDNIRNEDNVGGMLGATPLPFAGVGSFYMSVEVAYSNPATTNFILKGGAFLGGVALFFLAIASTPYYDPVRNWFSGAIE
jgi:hypothetical protein